MDEQQFYSEYFLVSGTSQLISKSSASLLRKVILYRLHPFSYSFGHDPKFVTIGEGMTID